MFGIKGKDNKQTEVLQNQDNSTVGQIVSAQAQQPQAQAPVVSQGAAPTQTGVVQPAQQAVQQPQAQVPVDYNNNMAQQPTQQNDASAQINPVMPHAQAATLTEHREKIRRPINSYRYTIINNLGKKEQGTFDAESADDVRNFLLSLEFQVLEVKERSKFDVDIGGGKFNASDLSFSLTQLSTYLKAGIPLADSVKILAKQSKKKAIKKSFYELVYQLLKGESLSDAMAMQEKTFPKLLINMVKTAEMTGDLPSILDDMAEYYTSMDQTKKQMKSAMTYPVVVLLIALGVLIFMLTYLVPQFSSMFEENGAELPTLTKTIMAISDFIKEKWYIVLIVLVGAVITFYELFKKVQKFKEKIQVMLMHFPVVKDIIIYNEIANFTKTFASLLNHGVFITDSMEILSKITNNEVYKKIINNTLENLGRGDSISSAFKGEWAIPVVAYEMIVTGETTGQLGQMMEKVATHFQMLHKNVIDQMKSLVEPILICFLAAVVGVILLSIIQPMFSIYSQIK